ncbi:2136_t:CDS:2 [Dentiscutata heterogama]|uniref:2136_t:CDS:1 n=1 Tax=Dentiscutata heterogama TaxID=1316150 RepID=A0ACA9L488_9GLOM|nr:2136_t:CDS:2 [Dentiscutata heterogama]
MCIVQGYSNHLQQPGYYCQARKHFSNIEESCRESATKVWQKMSILQKLDSFTLFGLNDNYTKKKLELRRLPTCQPNNWTNFEIMNQLFLYYLQRCTLSNINWWCIFLKWAQKISGIIEIWSTIRKIYSPNYEFND